MTNLRIRLLYGASLALLALGVSCLDPKNDGGSTSGTTLIAFDTAETAGDKRILIWDQLDQLVEQTGEVKPVRTLSDKKISQVKDLAWGGLVVDGANQRLYAVSTTGDVLRISNIYRYNGAISNPDDIQVFQVSDRLSDGVFEQAAFDSTSNTLYMLETNKSQTRVWAVSNPQSVLTASVQARKVEVEGGADKGGTGLAARNGSLFGFFSDGATVTDLSKNQYEKERLRQAVGATSFPQSSSVIIGDRTMLGIYGSLAADKDGNTYVARHLTDSTKTGEPILYFRNDAFTLSYNQAPASFGGTSLKSLRVIAHTGTTKDWLAGIDMVDAKATSTIHLWKNVSQRGAAKSISAGAGTLIKGIALDGSR